MQLNEIGRQMGLERINVGSEFDPTLITVLGSPSNTGMRTYREIRPGYTYRGSVVCHALIEVVADDTDTVEDQVTEGDTDTEAEGVTYELPTEVEVEDEVVADDTDTVEDQVTEGDTDTEAEVEVPAEDEVVADDTDTVEDQVTEGDTDTEAEGVAYEVPAEVEVPAEDEVVCGRYRHGRGSGH